MNEQNLFNKIMLRIRAEERATAVRRKVAMFSVVTALSFIGLIPAVKAAYSGFASSGFTQLFSLMFSDTSIIINSWQNFVLSLLETLPINGILITGFLTIMFFGSLKFLSNNLKNNYEYRQNFSIKVV